MILRVFVKLSIFLIIKFSLRRFSNNLVYFNALGGDADLLLLKVFINIFVFIFLALTLGLYLCWVRVVHNVIVFMWISRIWLNFRRRYILIQIVNWLPTLWWLGYQQRFFIRVFCLIWQKLLSTTKCRSYNVCGFLIAVRLF